eukprot:SAG31_NODE_7286_length_1731_cov_3.663603_1_plen_69_part_10
MCEKKSKINYNPNHNKLSVNDLATPLRPATAGSADVGHVMPVERPMPGHPVVVASLVAPPLQLWIQLRI